MKLFGEYLVEQGLISKAELLNTLLLQVRDMPSMAECVYSAKLVSDDRLLEALKYQSLHSVDLLSALRALGHYNDDLDQKLKEQVAGRRVPLGQLLLKQGLLDFESLVKQLDDFIYESRKDLGEREDQDEVQLAPEETSQTSNKLEPVAAGNSIDTLSPDFSDIDADLFEGFFEIFNENAFATLENASGSVTPDSISEVVSSYNSFLLSARFIKCGLVERLAEELVHALPEIVSSSPAKVSELMVAANECFRGLYRSLKEHQTERIFWEQDQSRERYLKLIGSFEQANQDEVSFKKAADF